MKPGFALNLSPEGISLLARDGGEWRLIGNISLDSADLGTELAALRRRAADLNGGDFSCKLVIPNSQILFTEVDAPGPDAAARKSQIRAALIGLTPYSVDDLVFDWSETDGTVRVAAVARETLEEAEAFAAEHEFNPVSFVAQPEPGKFTGEPFFGVTAHSDTALGATETVEPDHDAVRVPDPAERGSKPDTPVGKTAPPPPAEPGPDTGPRDGAFDDDGPAVRAQPSAKAPVPSPAIKTVPEKNSAEINADIPDGQREEPRPQSGLSFSSTRSGNARDAGAAPARLGQIRSRLMVSPVAADHSAPPIEAIVKKPVSVTGAKAPRRDGKISSPSAPKPKPPAITDVAADTDTAGSKKDGSGFLDAAASLTPEPPDSLKTGTQRAGGKDAASFTIFGAGKTAQPRRLGLILTLVLLALIALVAVWSSLFSDNGITRVSTGAEIAGPSALVEIADLNPGTPPKDDTALTAAEQTVDTAPLAPETATPASEAARADKDFKLASLPPAEPLSTQPDAPGTSEIPAPPQPREDTANSLDTGGVGEPEPPRPLTEAEAARAYAASGFWQKSPALPPSPRSGRIGALYIASIDPEISSQDAVALPALPASNADTVPAAIANPVAAGTAFEFDQRGLVVATRDGALSPEGVLVFTGKPSNRMTPRPERKTDVTAAVAEALANQVANAALAGKRPKARPADLIERGERARLGGRTLAQLSKIRPKPRPKSIQQAVEDHKPTTLAVASSRKPSFRPKGFATIVAKARAAREAQSTKTAAKRSGGVAAAPASPAPKIPTSASVAKRATVENALNMKKVSLIGVYGSASQRRALIRLSNGRFIKVKVGDKVDGGKVAAIGRDELRYIKRGKNIVLKMPEA